MQPQVPDRLHILSELGRMVLWLSSWTIHNANHIRGSDDRLKIGRHRHETVPPCEFETALPPSVAPWASSIKRNGNPGHASLKGAFRRSSQALQCIRQERRRDRCDSPLTVMQQRDYR
jgi:hypothetical protein